MLMLMLVLVRQMETRSTLQKETVCSWLLLPTHGVKEGTLEHTYTAAESELVIIRATLPAVGVLIKPAS